MGGRWKLWLAGGVLCGVFGCTKSHTRPDGEGPLAAKRVEVSVSDDSPVRPETLIAMAEVRVSAAEDPNKSNRDRDFLLNDARKTYQQVLERVPGHMGAVSGLARVHAALGERDRAIDVYRQATQKHPENAAVWFEMGTMLGRFKDWQGASESFAEAVRLEPDSRHYRTSLGFTLARLGKVEDGFGWLSKGRSEPEARFLLAQMLRHVDNEAACQEQLTLALKADPNYAPARELMTAMNPPPAPPPTASVADEGVKPARYDLTVAPAAPPKVGVATPEAPKPVARELLPAPATPPEPLPLNLTRGRAPAPVLSVNQ